MTNGNDDVQRAKLRQLGVEDVFDVVVTSGETGHEKGEEEIYNIALQQLDVAARDAWMVGDSLDQDVALPQTLGMKGIWVVWPTGKYRELYLDEDDRPQNSNVVPDLIVKRLEDLLLHLN